MRKKIAKSAFRITKTLGVTIALGIGGIYASHVFASGLDEFLAATVRGDSTDLQEKSPASVGAVRISTSIGTCSGTAISRRMILTAAHCLDGVESASVILCQTANEDGDCSYVRSKKLVTHPGYRKRRGERIEKDLGIIILERPLRGKLRSPNMSSSPGLISAVTLSQYGASPFGTDGLADAYRVSRGAAFSFGESVHVRGSAACAGDSGSGVLSWKGERPRIIGIVSGGLRRGGGFCSEGLGRAERLTRNDILWIKRVAKTVD